MPGSRIPIVPKGIDVRGGAYAEDPGQLRDALDCVITGTKSERMVIGRPDTWASSVAPWNTCPIEASDDTLYGFAPVGPLGGGQTVPILQGTIPDGTPYKRLLMDSPPNCCEQTSSLNEPQIHGLLLIGDTPVCIATHSRLDQGPGNPTVTCLHVFDGRSPTWVKDSFGMFDYVSTVNAGTIRPAIADHARIARFNKPEMAVMAGKLWVSLPDGSVAMAKSGNPRAFDLRLPSEIESLGEDWYFRGAFPVGLNTVVALVPAVYDDFIFVDDAKVQVLYRYSSASVQVSRNSSWQPIIDLTQSTAAEISDGGTAYARSFTPTINFTITRDATTGFCRITVTRTSTVDFPNGVDHLFRLRALVTPILINPPVPTWTSGVTSIPPSPAGGKYGPSIALNYQVHKYTDALVGTYTTIGHATMFVLTLDNVNTTLTKGIAWEEPPKTSDNIVGISMINGDGAKAWHLYNAQPLSKAYGHYGNPSIPVKQDEAWLAKKRAEWSTSAGAGDAAVFPTQRGDTGGNVVRAIAGTKDRGLIVYDRGCVLLQVSADPKQVRVLDNSQRGAAVNGSLLIGNSVLFAGRQGYEVIDLTDFSKSSIDSLDLGMRLGALANAPRFKKGRYWPEEHCALMIEDSATSGQFNVMVLNVREEFSEWSRWRFTMTTGGANALYGAAICAGRLYMQVDGYLFSISTTWRSTAWSIETGFTELGSGRARKKLIGIDLDATGPLLLTVRPLATDPTQALTTLPITDGSKPGAPIPMRVKLQSMAFRVQANGSTATLSGIDALVAPLT